MMSRRLAVLVALLIAAPALQARDVYKRFLDPGLFPHHAAIVDTLERLKESPNDAGLHNDLGALVARDGFWRDALREFDLAAKLDKHTGRPQFNAGLVYAAQGEWRAARGAFKKSVSRDPGNWPGWWMLGYAEEKLYHIENAVEAYGKSLRVDTSLYDVSRNPFAADTRLKGRVLLETYENRIARAALKGTQQLADRERITTFYQYFRPRVDHQQVSENVTDVTVQSAPVVEESGGNTGPVVSTVSPAGPGGAPSTNTNPARRGGLRSVPPRAPRQEPVPEQQQPPRRLPVTEQPGVMQPPTNPPPSPTPEPE